MNYQQLLQKYPIITDQIGHNELAVILQACEGVLAANTPGDIVEFGCYQGTTSLFLQRLLMARGSSQRQLHVYDSFEGLPAKSAPDASGAGNQFQAGELAVSKKQLLREFTRAGLPLPRVHKGWFSELTAADVPQTIAFAFLDGDFYQSITDSLRLVWPRMASGGVVAIDDYNVDALPGVERAIRDFFAIDTVTVHNEATIAIITKP